MIAIEARGQPRKPQLPLLSQRDAPCQPSPLSSDPAHKHSTRCDSSIERAPESPKVPARTYFNAHRFGTLLFDLEKDPDEEPSIVDEEVGRLMQRLMLDWMRWNAAPPEQYERLGLPVDGEVCDEHLLLAREYEEYPIPRCLGSPYGHHQH